MNNHEPIKPEDYQEPRCLLIDPNTGQSQAAKAIPMDRIVQKLDEYCDRKDFAGAQRHLQYWLDEALYNHDLRGAFSMRNEMMGFYRKQGARDQAIENALAALQLMQELDNEQTISGGTCFVNCGTVYDNFGEPEEALRYFKKAQEIYESIDHVDPGKLGGLYNNMGLAYMDTGSYAEAGACFSKALDMMAQVPHGELESAITLLNIADAAALEKGLEGAQEEIDRCLRYAGQLLDTPDLPRNGYYAFVCERCAPGFYCYGFDEAGAELEARAAAIRKELGA